MKKRTAVNVIVKSEFMPLKPSVEVCMIIGEQKKISVDVRDLDRIEALDKQKTAELGLPPTFRSAPNQKNMDELELTPDDEYLMMAMRISRD